MDEEPPQQNTESHLEKEDTQKINSRKTFKTFQLDITNKGLEILENDADLLYFARPETYSVEEIEEKKEKENQNPLKAYLWFRDGKVTSASSIYKLLEKEVIDIKTAGPCPKSIKESRLGNKAKKIQAQTKVLMNSLQKANSNCHSLLKKRMRIDWNDTNDGSALNSIDCLSNNPQKKVNTEPTISPSVLSQLVNVMPSSETYCVALHGLVERDKVIEGLKKQNQEIQTALDQLLLISENPSSSLFFENFQPIISNSNLSEKILRFYHNLQKIDQQFRNSKALLEQARRDNDQLKLNKDNLEKETVSESFAENEQMGKLEERNKQLEKELGEYKNETKSLCSYFKTKSGIIQKILMKEEEDEKGKGKRSRSTSNGYLADHQELGWDEIRTISSGLLEKANTLHERNIDLEQQYDDIKIKFDQNKEKLVKIQELLTSSEQWSLCVQQVMDYLKRKAELSEECNFFYPDWCPKSADRSKKYTLIPFLYKNKSWHLLIYCNKGDHRLLTSSNNISDNGATSIVVQHFGQDFKGVVKKEYLPTYPCRDETKKTSATILMIAWYAANFFRNPEGIGFQKPNGKKLTEESEKIPREFVEATTFKILLTLSDPILQGVNEIETY
jgi:hypothetical protein